MVKDIKISYFKVNFNFDLPLVMRKSFITSFFLFLTICLYSQNYSFEEQNARSFYELNYPYSAHNLDNLSIDTSLVYKT